MSGLRDTAGYSGLLAGYSAHLAQKKVRQIREYLKQRLKHAQLRPGAACHHSALKLAVRDHSDEEVLAIAVRFVL